MNLANVITALLGSRKAIVSAGATILVGIVTIFFKGSDDEKKTIIASITTIASVLVHSIAKEDAAAKVIGPASGAPDRATVTPPPGAS